MAVGIVDDEGRRVVEGDRFALNRNALLSERFVRRLNVSDLEGHQRFMLARRRSPAMPEELNDGMTGDKATDEERARTGGRRDSLEFRALESAFQDDLNPEDFAVEGEGAIEIRYLEGDVRESGEARTFECKGGRHRAIIPSNTPSDSREWPGDTARPPDP